MKNKKFDVGGFIFSLFTLLFDCFWIWWNASLVFEYYHAEKFNQAAVFVVGTVIWCLLLNRDGKDCKENMYKEDEIKTKNESSDQLLKQ